MWELCSFCHIYSPCPLYVNNFAILGSLIYVSLIWIVWYLLWVIKLFFYGTHLMNTSMIMLCLSITIMFSSHWSWWRKKQHSAWLRRGNHDEQEFCFSRKHGCDILTAESSSGAAGMRVRLGCASGVNPKLGAVDDAVLWGGCRDAHRIGNAFSKSNPKKFWNNIYNPIPIQKKLELKNCIQIQNFRKFWISEQNWNWIISDLIWISKKNTQFTQFLVPIHPWIW